ncbi:MAG: hypothetical protein IJC29_02590, partial [Clostridia bacterium]|nr:hypothetical protein [Clostridia bacterium]
TTVTEMEEEETYTERVTADGMEVIDGAETEVKLVKGSTENQEGTLVNATFSGITSSSADGKRTSTFTLPTPVTLGFADTLNVEEGRVYRNTSLPLAAAEITFDKTTTDNGIVWIQFWRSDVKVGGVVLANVEMQTLSMSDLYLQNTTDGTMRVYSKGASNNFVRMIVGTRADLSCAGDKATEAEIRAYLAQKNVIFAYEMTKTRTEEEVPCPKGYPAYNGGTEQIEGNGMAVTVTQTYLTPKGAQS